MSKMMRSIRVHVDWVSPECGGRDHPPFVGMRPMIRWSRYVEKWLANSWDAEIVEWSPVRGERNGTAVLRFSGGGAEEEAPFAEGEQVEMLDGHRVIGVGCIQANAASHMRVGQINHIEVKD
jgi:hypothetical protein